MPTTMCYIRAGLNRKMKATKRILTCLLAMGSSLLVTDLTAQPVEGSQTAEFSIEIEFDKEEAELSCEQGCNWEELEFDLAIGESVYVSPVGISPKVLTDTHLDFQFLLKRTGKNAVLLTKVSGAVWTQLEGEAIGKKEMVVDHKGITIP